MSVTKRIFPSLGEGQGSTITPVKQDNEQSKSERKGFTGSSKQFSENTEESLKWYNEHLGVK